MHCDVVCILNLNSSQKYWSQAQGLIEKPLEIRFDITSEPNHFHSCNVNLNSEIMLNQALIQLDEACFDFASQQPTSNVAKWWTPLKVMVSFVSEIPSANELGVF